MADIRNMAAQRTQTADVLKNQSVGAGKNSLGAAGESRSAQGANASRPGQGDPVILARDVRKRYAGFAPVLRGVNLDVYPGEIVAIMGPSGCGKSTMLHVLGLLHAPDSGTVEILGKDVLSLNREETAAFRRDNLGFVMQQSNLFDHSTVFENVEFPLIYREVPAQERWPRVIRALELVRLSSRVHYPSNRLSGGEQQRVAIARAMVNNPRILMADEPTGALDQRTSRLVMENFRTLCHTGGVALVMVTHDANMAEFCDTVYTLEEGVLVCQRREIPAIPGGVRADLLKGPDIRLSTAMVSSNFLKAGGEGPRTQAHMLHEKGLLTHVVTLQAASILGKEMQSYSLPMPVRHMGGMRATSVWKGWFSQKSLGTREADFGPMKGLLKGVGVRWVRAQGQDLAQWANQEKIRCLYAAGGVRAPIVCWIASRLGSLPFAMDVRDTDAWSAHLEGGKEEVRRALATLVRDAVFVRCTTKELRDRMVSALPKELNRKVVWIPDPLTLGPMDEEVAVAQTHEAAKLPHILACGVLEERKGFDVLLKALSRLKSMGREFRCTIAGEGPKLKALKGQTKSLGLSGSVKFPGFVPHANMNSLYLDADVFVACGTSRKGEPSDGIPSSLGEAMAFFVPTVVSDLPDQAWLVGECGSVVPQGDDEALARALEPLLKLEDRQDLDRRQERGNCLHERVMTLLEKVPEAQEALFEPLLKGDIGSLKN